MSKLIPFTPQLHNGPLQQPSFGTIKTEDDTLHVICRTARKDIEAFLALEAIFLSGPKEEIDEKNKSKLMGLGLINENGHIPIIVQKLLKLILNYQEANTI